MKNKNRAASYQKGEAIAVQCKQISEVATIIHGLKCEDQRDWLRSSLKNIERRIPETIATSSGDLPAFQVLSAIRKGIKSLPHNTPCITSIKNEACLEQFKEVSSKYIQSLSNPLVRN